MNRRIYCRLLVQEQISPVRLRISLDDPSWTFRARKDRVVLAATTSDRTASLFLRSAVST